MALGRRSFYEDPDARISILARAGAHGPDTLMQTVQIKSRKLLADGAGHTFCWVTAINQSFAFGAAPAAQGQLHSAPTVSRLLDGADQSV
jgi:hypothetical protein